LQHKWSDGGPDRAAHAAQVFHGRPHADFHLLDEPAVDDRDRAKPCHPERSRGICRTHYRSLTSFEMTAAQELRDLLERLLRRRQSDALRRPRAQMLEALER